MSLMTALTLNASGFTDGLKKAEADTKGFSDVIGTASKETIKAFKDISQMGIGEMKKNMRELRNISFAGKTKEEIAAINNQIGQLNDRMGDLRAEQNSMGMEFGQAMSKGLQVGSAMIQVVVGIGSAFGLSKEESVKYQQAMTQLIGVTQALGVIENAYQQKIFTTIGLKIKDAAVTAAQTVATWAATAAQWAYNTALLVVIGTIGAAVVAVAAITAGIYLLVAGRNKEKAAVEAQRKAYNDLAAARSRDAGWAEFQLKISLEFAKSEKEKIQLEINAAEAKRRSLRITLDALAQVGKKTEEEIQAFKEGSEEEIKLGDEIIIKKIQLGKAIDAEVIPKVKETTAAVKVQKDAWVEAYEKAQQLAQYDVPQFIKGVTDNGADVAGMEAKKNAAIDQSANAAAVEGLRARYQKQQDAIKAYYNVVVSEAAQAAAKLKQIEDDQLNAKLDAVQNSLDQGMQVFAQNTVAYKAMAIAQATMDTYRAANVALASAPAPYNFILMATTIAAGIANVGKIAGVFASGGIVPGSQMSGDNVLARVNSREMILNGRQQAELFAIANGGGSGGGGQVTFRIDGTQLVGVLSNQGKKRFNTK